MSLRRTSDCFSKIRLGVSEPHATSDSFFKKRRHAVRTSSYFGLYFQKQGPRCPNPTQLQTDFAKIQAQESELRSSLKKSMVNSYEFPCFSLYIPWFFNPNLKQSLKNLKTTQPPYHLHPHPYLMRLVFSAILALSLHRLSEQLRIPLQ